MKEVKERKAPTLIFWYTNSVGNHGPEFKIDLPVKKAKIKYYAILKIQTCQKLIARKVLCFFHSKVLKLDSINSRTVSNISKLDSSLDPRNVQVSRIEDWVESFEFRVTVNLHLTSTVGWEITLLFLWNVQKPSLAYWSMFFFYEKNAMQSQGFYITGHMIRTFKFI